MDVNYICTKCGKAFYKKSTMTICNECNNIRVKSMSPEWRMWNRCKSRANEKGYTFDLEISDIHIPEVCPILGHKLEVHSGRSGGEPTSPALDRIDNSKGYVKGNIRVISHQANIMKSYATPEQLQKFANWILTEFPE